MGSDLVSGQSLYVTPVRKIGLRGFSLVTPVYFLPLPYSAKSLYSGSTFLLNQSTIQLSVKGGKEVSPLHNRIVGTVMGSNLALFLSR